jgi:hypothetical protein
MSSGGFGWAKNGQTIARSTLKTARSFIAFPISSREARQGSLKCKLLPKLISIGRGFNRMRYAKL